MQKIYNDRRLPEKVADVKGGVQFGRIGKSLELSPWQTNINTAELNPVLLGEDSNERAGVRIVIYGLRVPKG